MWVPAHVSIESNELADKEAKDASAQIILTPNTQVSHTDCIQAIKHKIPSQTEEKWKVQAIKSAGNYFQHYYKKANTPWLHNKKILRHMTVWINKARAEHHSFASSLAKVGLVQDAPCNRGHTMQDLDHIICFCPNYS